MIILSLNSGSSSLKFQLYDYEKHETMSTGIVERVTIGGSLSVFQLWWRVHQARHGV